MRIIYFCFYLILSSGRLFGQWSLNAEVDHPGCLHEIEFVTDSTGYVVANNLIGKTTDVGDTWNFDTSQEGAFRIIDFINLDTLLVCCYPEIGYDVMISYDAGLNWSYPNLHTSWQIQDIEFLSNTRIITAEAIEPINSIIHVVDNFYNDDLGTFVLSETFPPYDLDFPSNDVGFVCGYLYSDVFSSVFKSIDGGLNWYTTENMLGPIYRMSFANNNVGYGIGDERRVWKTVDSGENWNLLPFDFGYAIDDENFILDEIYFYNESIGLLETYTYHDDGDITMEIRRTIDGGETWYLTDYPYDDFSGVESFFCTNTDTCFFVTCDNIYKTLNGGGVDTSEVGIEWEDETQFNIFPNPASSYIKLMLSGYTDAYTIRTYNYWGILVEVKFNSDNIANIKQLPSGIYITELSTPLGKSSKVWLRE